jgi:predicted nucleotidyltransferase
MEGKKSFVLYTDQREVFDELSDEDAGRLIKHIFSYVNDEDPSTEDLLLKVAFLPIKTQLKRDLKMWDEKKQQRAEAGRKGGVAKASNAKQTLAKPSNAKNDVANLAVNVNVNDNVNDIYIQTEKILKVDVESHNQIFRELWHSTIWLEGIAMKHKVTTKEVQDHMNEFREECILKEELKVDQKDAKEHFINWIKRGNPFPDKKEESPKYPKSTLKDNWW